MRVILWKLISDFRNAKGKLVLLLLAASLSGWGISSVIYSYFLTERDFQENFIQSYPADMTVVVENYSEALKEQFLADPNVIDIERREVVNARIKNKNGSWMPLILFAADNLEQMRYDKFKILDMSNEIPEKILVERNAYYYLGQDPAKLEIQFQSDTEPVFWELSGKVHDARLAPATMEGVVYGFSTSLAAIEPYMKKDQRRLLIKTNVSADREALQETYNRLQHTAKLSEGRIIGVNIPEPGEHMHQGIVDGIAFFQESGGKVLSAMGVILLSLILLTWIFPQISDIGVMKAIGASTQHIFMSYAMILGFIVIAGLMIGMPIGYKTATLYNGFVARIQNFDEVQDILPFYSHTMVVLTGFLIPILFGIIPLSKAAKTSVNEAMHKTFYVSFAGFFRVTQKLISSPQMKYQLNNLWRHSQRTILMILLITIGIALFFTSSNVGYSIKTDLDEFAGSARYEIVASLPREMNRADIRFLNQLPDVKNAVPMRTDRVTYLPPETGYPELTRLTILSSEVIIDDSYIQRGKIDKNCSKCIYVSNEHMRLEYEDVALGEQIEFTSSTGKITSYTFSGVIRDLPAIAATFIVYNDQAIRTFDAVAIELNAGLSKDDILNVSNSIDDTFRDNGINLRGKMGVQERTAAIMNHLVPSLLTIKVMGIFTIILGLFGLVIVLNLTIKERTREIGILKAIGSSQSKISGMFNQEFMMTSLVAIAAGGLLAMPVSEALIDVIAETVVRHPVLFRNDVIAIVVGIVVILVGQAVLISIYNRFKIGKNVRGLLDHNF